MEPKKKRKQTWLAGKSPFLIGDTSSNAWFSIAMLVKPEKMAENQWVIGAISPL